MKTKTQKRNCRVLGEGRESDFQCRYEMPLDQINSPSVKKAEQLIARTLANPRERRATLYHEAFHTLTFQKYGVPTSYRGPAVGHLKESDRFYVVFGEVRASPEACKKLTAEQMARVAVAGIVAEKVLLGTANPPGKQMDFETYISSGQGGKKASELIYLFKLAEEQLTEELRADLNLQRDIVHEAARCEQAICGFDESVKNEKRGMETYESVKDGTTRFSAIPTP